MSKLFEAMENADRDRNSLRPSLASELRVVAPPRVDFDAEMLELYRSLGQRLGDLAQKVILFSGVEGGEGTSTVVSSLARVAAGRLSRKVAVLDMDIRSPTQQRLFGIDASIGWYDVLKGTADLDEAIHPTTVANLSVVPCSPSSARGSEIIDAGRMGDLFVSLTERFNLILVDGATPSALSDSVSFSQKTDGVVLIIAADSTRWPVAQALIRRITGSGSEVLGVVLNKRQYYIPELIYRRL